MTENKGIIDQLFKAGAHIGFSKTRRHPSVVPYIYGTKQGADIFDLEKTNVLLENACEYLKTIGSTGKPILFVGTKEEIADIVKREADKISMPSVTKRWIGGTLTNLPEIKKRINRYLTLKEQASSGELERKYTKKERVVLGREVERLEYNFGGITSTEELPAAVVVIDPRHEHIAVAEARSAKVPVVALMSSDCDVASADVPVVMNDAHRDGVSFVLSMLANAYGEGRVSYVPKAPVANTRVRRERTES